MLKHSATQLQNHISGASEALSKAVTPAVSHRPNAYQRAIDLKHQIDANYVTFFP
jgi:hypothetical protein